MHFKDFMVFDATIPELESTTMESSIEEIIDALVAVKKIKKKYRKTFIDAIIERELLGSTAVGGLAMPHARIEGAGKLVGVYARSKDGMEFNSLDGEPVYSIFLLVSGPEEKAEHLKALKIISQLSHNPTICSFLKMSRDSVEINSTLEEFEAVD